MRTNRRGRLYAKPGKTRKIDIPTKTPITRRRGATDLAKRIPDHVPEVIVTVASDVDVIEALSSRVLRASVRAGRHSWTSPDQFPVTVK